MTIRYLKGELVYVSPGSVSFTQEQCRWLLSFFNDLRDGMYVPEPGAESTGRSSNRHNAPHELACQIYAELDERLSRTGIDRYIVEEMYSTFTWEGNCYRNPFPSEIARRIHRDEEDVIRIAQSAISYIGSGTCPRWKSCTACGEWDKCRRKYRGRRPWEYNEWKSKHSRDIKKVIV